MNNKENLLELNYQQKLAYLTDVYSKMSAEEFKRRLIELGFEIVEGIKGQIFFDEEIFVLDAEICKPQHEVYIINSKQEFEIEYVLGAA